MTRAQALQLARDIALDLVEVAPGATPPVCRILDYGKVRYLQSKKQKEIIYKTQKKERTEPREESEYHLNIKKQFYFLIQSLSQLQENEKKLLIDLL